MRSYTVSEAEDELGCRMRFGVLYGEVLVEINVKGARPEEIYTMPKHLLERSH